MKIKSLFNFFALVVLFLAMVGCEKSDVATNNHNIVGCWINPVYMDNVEGKLIYHYERSKKLTDNSGGIKFLYDGTLINRANAGWCGTPPITYSNFSGNWQIQENGDIVIDATYWGGMSHVVWKIIGITNKILTIEVLSQEYEMDL